jgi:hypothetical protein
VNLLRQLKSPKFFEDAGYVIAISGGALLLHGYALRLMLFGY